MSDYAAAMPEPTKVPEMYATLGDVPASQTAHTAESSTMANTRLSQQPWKKAKIALAVEPTDEARREKAVAAWKRLVMSNPTAFDCGRKVLAASSENEANESFRLTLVDRRAGTLIARLSAAQAYETWARASGAGWPPKEADAWQYLCTKANTSLALTRAQTFMELMKFLKHVLGADSMDQVIESRRLTGTAAERSMQLGTRRQAATLTLAEVEMLEHALQDVRLSAVEVVVAGVALVMLSLRARFGDMKHITAVKVDGQYLVATVSQTKTSGRATDRLKLQMVGLRLLITGRNWYEDFQNVRTQMQIPFGEWFMLPAHVDGHWINQPAGLRDFNVLLQSLLQKIGCTQTTSHGLKATLLRFASQQGISAQARAALGYHAIKGESSSVRAYSRDRLSAPMAKLEAAVNAYRTGSPAMIVSSGMPEHDLVSSESSSSEEETVLIEGEAEVVSKSLQDKILWREQVHHLRPKRNTDARRFVHVMTGKVHCGRAGVDAKLACGRRLSTRCRSQASEEEAASVLLCRSCHRTDQSENPTSTESSD